MYDSDVKKYTVVSSDSDTPGSSWLTSVPFKQWCNKTLQDDIKQAVQKHVYRRMPIRVVRLPQMNLLNRNGIVKDITFRIFSEINESQFEDMVTHKLLREIFSSEGEAYQEVTKDVVKRYGAYAILSHTWIQDNGDGGEITYGDVLRTGFALSTMEHIGIESKTAYKKVDGFCKAAYRDGYLYAWLDTICINQDSTSELDESIRSMYRWYQHSGLCITHLADTTTLFDMKNDRWFTRGWTLQELLAPEKIKFYSRDWKLLGATSNVEKELGSNTPYDAEPYQTTEVELIIEKVAGITPQQRSQYRPGVTSNIEISRRMEWAANRATTRGEDLAYCLMGIFGVSFSIAYGEGAERAFFRLIEAILTSFRDISDVLAWGGRPISDEIHSTSLIPSSPKCYSAGPHRAGPMFTSRFIPVEPLLLTHIGLRIRVLLIRGEYRSSAAHFVDGADINIKFRLKGYQHKPVQWHEYTIFSQNSTVRLEGNGRKLIRRALVLGIWNIEDNNRVLVMPPVPCAFLFEVVVRRGEERHLYDSEIDNPFTPSCKVHTREAIRFISSTSSTATYRRILKEDLLQSLASIHTLYL